MTLTLIVLRHAKSGWGDPSLPDHDRTLTERGHRDAAAIGAWLAAHGHVPDLILSSDAARTVQTIADVIGGIGQDVQTQLLPMLYNASADTIRRVIRKQTAKTLLVCAHNPGIGHLASELISNPPSHSGFDDYPTAATAVISFDVASWADIETGNCLSFIIPADLKH